MKKSCLRVIAMSMFWLCTTVLANNSSYTDTLITEGPNGGQGVQPVLNLINNAQKSLQVTIYEVDDTSADSTSIQYALSQAADRGVDVQIIYSSGEDMTTYTDAEEAFCKANPKIRCEESSTTFTYTHEKAFIVDGDEAVIQSFNWVNNGTYDYFNGLTRDFALVTNNPEDVTSLENQFTLDWVNAQKNTTDFPKLATGTRLFFSNTSSININEGNGNSYNNLYSLINSAKQSVDIYTEELENTNYSAGSRLGQDLMELINTKAADGIKFRIITEDCTATELKLGSNVQVISVPSSDPIYYHAKAVIVDEMADLMSTNFSQTSIYSNREAGITLGTLSDSDVDPNVQTLQSIFNSDWETLSAKYKSSCVADAVMANN
jgi:phosphatidylserine/phosphatidylglycerophosphate/cardiolipin synthase-like enzyme